MSETTINRFKWASDLLTLVGVLLGIMAATTWLPSYVQQWMALGAALVVAGAKWCEGKIPAREVLKDASIRPPVALLALALGALLLVGCASWYATARKTVATVRDVGTAADKTIASVVEAKHSECLTIHGAKTQGYADCIGKHKKALDAWRTIARPAVNTALVTTVAALQIAEKTGDKKLDWKALLKEGACVLAKQVSEWKPLLGDKYQDVASAAAFVEVFSCR